MAFPTFDARRKNRVFLNWKYHQSTLSPELATASARVAFISQLCGIRHRADKQQGLGLSHRLSIDRDQGVHWLGIPSDALVDNLR